MEFLNTYFSFIFFFLEMFRAARAARAAKASRAQSRKFSSKPNNGNGESPGISFSTFFSINAILVPGSLVAAAYASSRDPAAAARVKQIPGVGAAVEWTGEMMGFSASSGNSSSTSRIVTEEETIKAAPAKKMVAENVEKKVSEKKEEKKVVKKEAVVEKKEAPVVAKKEDTPKEAASQTPAPVVTMDTFPPAPSQKPVRQEKTAVEQATPVDPAVPPVVIIDYSHLPQVREWSLIFFNRGMLLCTANMCAVFIIEWSITKPGPYWFHPSHSL